MEELIDKKSIYLEYFNQGDKVVVPVDFIKIIEQAKKGNNAPLYVQVNDFFGFLKNSKNSSTSFDDIEYVVCQIGKLFGVKVAETFKLYRDEEFLGIVSKSMIKNNEKLYMVDNFGALFKNENQDFDKEVNKIENLRDLYLKKFIRSDGTEINLPVIENEDDIKAIVESFLKIIGYLGVSEDEYKNIRKCYFDMIMFDFLINNVDRNQSNFGLLMKRDSKLDFYPLFDNATIEIPYIPEGYQNVNGFFVNKEALLNILYNNFYSDIVKFSAQIVDNDELNRKAIEKLCKENLEESDIDWFLNKLRENYLKLYNFEIEKKKKIDKNLLNYCFHTHTYRCGHTGISKVASFFPDKEFVQFARANGVIQLGFSDHVPTLELGYYDENERMHISEVDEYVNSINALKNSCSDMQILCGFEADFDPMKTKFLIDLRGKVDYMVLGQHFVSNINKKNNPNYPLEYAKVVCQGIESGIFDIIAHPDIFMSLRDDMEGVNYNLFLENAKIASKKICMKAKEYGIPIEINLREVLKERIMKDGINTYPHPLFWDIAVETQVPVIYGLDAHFPQMFDSMENAKEALKNFINVDNLNFVSEFYNPVLERTNNRLDNLYDERNKSVFTYEANFAEKFIMEMGINGEFTLLNFLVNLNKKLDRLIQNCTDEYTSRREKKLKDYLLIQESLKEQSEEKEYCLKRLEKTLFYLDKTLEKQKELVLNMKKAITISLKSGCLSKEDLKRNVVEFIDSCYLKESDVKKY